jgi:hypothetical protein
MSTTPQKKDDRLFVRDGRRSHRRKFSLTEFRLGLGVLAVLALITAWLLWKGAHPDPALFAASIGTETPAAATDRGPLPPSLAAPGWHERTLAWFDATNLYVKIDGREDYYKSFGFQRLGYVSLVHEADTTRIVAEFFDQGRRRTRSARKPASGRRGNTGRCQRVHQCFGECDVHDARGVTARAIGADTTAATRAQLAHVCRTLAAHLPGEPLPWAYALFAGQLGLDPGRVAFMPENAFSFGFARDVYAARLDDDSEIFVVVAPTESAAKALAQEFESGFAELADDVQAAHGVRWARDRYQATLAGVVVDGRWVTGVRGAPDLARGRTSLDRLRGSLRALPSKVVEQAFAAPAATGSAAGADATGEGSVPAPGKDLPPVSEPPILRGVETIAGTRPRPAHSNPRGRLVVSVAAFFRGRVRGRARACGTSRRPTPRSEASGAVAGPRLRRLAALAPARWPLSIKDPDGEHAKPQQRTLRLPEGGYALESLGAARLGVARGADITAMLRGAIDAIGGLPRFIQKGDVVLVKPNVAFERPAVLGATTNPEVLSALVRLVYEAGAKEVRVVDNPIESPESCFHRSGIYQAAVDAKARVYLPVSGDFETVNVAGATWIENWPFFWRPFQGVNKVIGVAPVKDHTRAS